MNCLFTEKKCSCNYIWPCKNIEEKEPEYLQNAEKNI